MFARTISLLCFVTFTLAEMTVPGIERSVSEGVRTVDFNVVYGDEDMTVINQVVSDAEKIEFLNSKTNLHDIISPLPAEDVKCLMSVDKYCSKNMLEIKGVLIQAIKDDCKECKTDEKEKAGQVVAAMLAHDPVAWKLFLTRSALQLLPERKSKKEAKLKYRVVGKPEIVEPSNKRFVVHGVKVKVKRFATEILA